MTVSWSPAVLDFGACDQDTGMDVTFTNSGSAPVGVFGIQTGAPYQVSADAAYLPAGGTGGVLVTFSPPGWGSFPGELDFQTGDPGFPYGNVPITGSSPTVTWTPASLDFGAISARSSATQTLVITNHGSDQLDITNVHIIYPAGQFHDFTAVPPATTNIIIPAGGVGTAISVTFSPRYVWPLGYTTHGQLVFDTPRAGLAHLYIPLSGSEQPQPGCVTAPAALASRAYRAVRRSSAARRGAPLE